MQFQKGAASFCVCARAFQIGPLLRNMQSQRINEVWRTEKSKQI